MDNILSNILGPTKLKGKHTPAAAAKIKGSAQYPNIRGTALFYPVKSGVIVAVQVDGLPYEAGKCKERIYAFHMHSGKSCTGNAEDPFADAGVHYNPDGCQHPQHAGDLPPLFGNKGYAFSAVLTDRFGIDDIIGHSVIIHSMPDDFKTQPSGNSGEKIACGIIKRVLRL